MEHVLNHLYARYPHAKIIMLLVAGSHMYGIDAVDSDVDWRGVFIPPVDVILGIDRLDQFRSELDDITLHTLRYYVVLLMSGVMDAHDWLWADTYKIVTSEIKPLIEMREKFLSDSMGKKILGYMNHATRRMEKGNPAAWGEKRRLLFQKCGYDSKDASHAIRLAYQGIRLYNEGVFYPRLLPEQITEIAQIKRGELSLPEIKAKITLRTAELEEARRLNKAKLPPSPDVVTLKEIVINAHKEIIHASCTSCSRRLE